jgi:hypothetical protein
MGLTARAIALTLAGAALAGPATAHADLSAARAERAARTAVAPAPVESTRCFKATVKQRRGVDRAFCVVNVVAPAGQECVATVAVTSRTRPRRVSAKVTIPLRCHPRQPGAGEL